MIWVLFSISIDSRRPRILLILLIILPVNSSGEVISSFITGSKSLGPAFFKQSLVAIMAAVLKAISDESTSWNEPSSKVALTFTTGKPCRIPSMRACLIPDSTAGIYSRGMAPPTILFTNSKLSSPGSRRRTIWANWPLPPVCFT